MQLCLQREIFNFCFLKKNCYSVILPEVFSHCFCSWKRVCGKIRFCPRIWVCLKAIYESVCHKEISEFPLYGLLPFTATEEKHEICLAFGVFICQNYEKKGDAEMDQTTILPASPVVFCLHRHCALAQFLGFISAAVWQNFAGRVPKRVWFWQ